MPSDLVQQGNRVLLDYIKSQQKNKKGTEEVARMKLSELITHYTLKPILRDVHPCVDAVNVILYLFSETMFCQ